MSSTPATRVPSLALLSVQLARLVNYKQSGSRTETCVTDRLRRCEERAVIVDQSKVAVLLPESGKRSHENAGNE